MRSILVALLLLLPITAGCLGGDAEGRFSLDVTDMPDDIGDFSSLNVTVDKIVLTGKDNKSVELTPSSPTFDLTKLLEGNTTNLFNDTVPAGEYNRLDLFFTNASGVLVADGSVVDVKAPSGRIFLNTAFTVTEGEVTTFLFDIQVHKTGNGEYQFKPNADGSGPGKDAKAEHAKKASMADENKPAQE